MLDKAHLDKILERDPKLEIVLRSGVVSMKMARRVLAIDKWAMEELYQDLIEAQAVKGVSSSNFKATPETLEYLEARANPVTLAREVTQPVQQRLEDVVNTDCTVYEEDTGEVLHE